jgi:hypothetical protein
MIAVTETGVTVSIIGLGVSLLVQTIFLGRWVGRTSQRIETCREQIQTIDAAMIRCRQTENETLAGLHSRINSLLENVSSCRQEIGRLSGQVEILLKRPGDNDR